MLLKASALASLLSGALYAALPANVVATGLAQPAPSAPEARAIDVALAKDRVVPARRLQFEQIDVDGLMGAPVIDPRDRFIGHVAQLMVDGNGRIQGLVLGVQPGLPGTYKEVAVETGEVEVLRAQAGQYIVQTKATRSALSAGPAFVPEYERVGAG